jgi:hypothetical protein
MGFANWLARKGRVGGTARTVAQGWKTIKDKNPGTNPIDIATTYVRKRYKANGDLHLAKEVLRMLHNVNPLNLSWAILMVENKDEAINLYDRMSEWQNILIQEIRKYGIDPE